MSKNEDVGKKGKGQMRQFAAPIADPRFAKLHSDPRFLKPNREEGKVVLDDRFKSLLNDDEFSSKGQRRPKLDKYGRPAKKDESEQNRLKGLYTADKERLSEEDEEDSDESEVEARPSRPIDYARGEGQIESSSEEESEDSESEDDEDDEEEEDVVIGSAAARRRELYRKDSDEDDDDDSEEEEDVELEQDGTNRDQIAKLDALAERTIKKEAKKASKSKQIFEGDTNRLAVVNMDWDHIRAIDLLKVFTSVVSPAGASQAGPSSKRHNERQIVPIQGRCLSVHVYPSEFGRKRMAKEMTEGPPREIFADGSNAESSSKKKRSKKKANRGGDSESDEEIFQVDEGGDFDEEALRKYQLDRLRYYYAIATFDRPETARFIMDEIDGTEMEHSANMFDLSFVPASMTFPDHEAPKDEPGNEGYRDCATESSNEASYSGVKFMTDALRHSKVTLTWDADDPQRSKVTRQAVEKVLTADQIRDEDFKAYLASASEESDPGEESDAEERGGDDSKAGAEKERMRALLGLNSTQSGFGKAKSSAFSDARKQSMQEGQGDMQITFMPGLSEAAERKKNGVKAKEEETTLEAYKRKQKEKRERRRQNRDDDDDDGEDGEKGAIDRKADYNFDDPFFASDGEVDFDAALADEKVDKKKGSKQDSSKKLHLESDNDDENNRKQLELMVDSEDDGETGAGHFSLKDILKAEQSADGKSKKNRWAKKKEKKLAKQAAEGIEMKRDKNEVQPGFEIDVKDSRFSGLYGDHRFALDPSHPNFIKTKNTQKLIDERRKQDKKKQNHQPDLNVDRKVNGKSSKSNNNDEDLSNLVNSFKKRAAAEPFQSSNGKKKKSK